MTIPTRSPSWQEFQRIAAVDVNRVVKTPVFDLASLLYAGNALKVVRVNAGATALELAVPSGGAGGTLTDGDKGDITVSAAGAAWAIDAGVVTPAQMANVATGTVFYRKTAATGVPEVQTLATLKTDLGLAGSNNGDQTITLTGDVTGTGTGSFAATIAADVVTFAKIANSSLASLLVGRGAAGQSSGSARSRGSDIRS